jgi:general secretion pathway protein G
MKDSRRPLRLHARGLTLVELIIVISIIGSLMGIIAFAIFQRKATADKELAKTACSQFRSAILLYRTTHPDGDCPSPQQLKAEKEIDSTTNIKDAWGIQFKITCDEEIVCTSAGPDRKEGTDDDIRVPPLEKR